MRLLALAACASLLLAGCSIPTDETAQVIAEDQLPEALQTPSTTATPVTTEPTTAPSPIWLLQNTAEGEVKLFRSERSLADRSVTGRLRSLLETTLTEEESEAQLINQWSLTGAALTISDAGDGGIIIELTTDGEAAVADVNEALGKPSAVAQMVFTALEDDAVDRVQFEVNDVPSPVTTSGGDAGESEAVDRCDFNILIPEGADFDGLEACDLVPTPTTTITPTTTNPPPSSSRPGVTRPDSTD